MKNFSKIIISIFIGLVVFCICSFVLSYQHSLFVGILAILIALWTNEGLPIGVVSLLPLILFPILGILEFDKVSTNYANPVIFLFLGGFMLAIATEKTNLHKIIANKLISAFPKSPFGIILSISLSSALLSGFISNTTTALMLIPIASFLTNNPKLHIRLLLAVAYGASLGGILTPIGTPPNLIFLGFLQSHNIQVIPFVNWIIMMLPLTMIMIVLMSWIMSRGLKNDNTAITLEKIDFSPEHRRLSIILLVLVVLLIVNSPIKPFYNGLGLDEKWILLTFGLFMFFPKLGFLNWEDTRKLPYEIIFLFGAGFAIANGFTATGLSTVTASYLSQIHTLPFFIVVIIVVTFAVFMTEITSNTALISVLLPVIYGLSATFPKNEMMLLQLVATIAASYAFMLPIATPPNAIAMSTGLVKVKDMARYGFILNILGIIFISLLGYFYWILFL